jgi:Effector Associated Constant Component 1
MRVELSIALDNGEPPADLQSLASWLRQDARLRGAVELVHRPPRPGEMGAVSDVLSVALGPGGSGIALAGALSVWLRTRTSDVKATVTGRNGTVTIDVHRAKDPAEVLEKIESIVGER